MGMLGSQCEFMSPFKLTQFWSKSLLTIPLAHFVGQRVKKGPPNLYDPGPKSVRQHKNESKKNKEQQSKQEKEKANETRPPPIVTPY